MQNIRSNHVCRATVYRVFQTLRSKSTVLNSAYKIYGPSPTPKNTPILVLHDCLGTKQNWDSICKRLSAQCKKTVIAVDARNHGDSPHCDSHDYKALANDLSNLISHFVLENCILIGHSMGGRTAMVTALQQDQVVTTCPRYRPYLSPKCFNFLQPSKVASLVVVDTSPVSTSSYMEITLPKIIEVLMSVDFNVKGMKLDEAREKARNAMKSYDLFETEAEREAVLMNIEKLPDRSIGWKYNLPVLKSEIDKIAKFPDMGKKTYSGPTLFLAGKLSYCVPTNDFAGIQKIFPEARLLYIDGVKHNVHFEDPDGLLQAVQTFFENNSLIKPETIT